MTGHKLGIVLVRLFSIYLAINTLQNFFYYLPAMIFTPDNWLSIASVLAVAAVLLPAALALWIWRRAETLVPEQGISEKSPISAEQLMLIGVSLLGLYFFVWGVVYLVRTESNLASTEHLDASTKWAQRAPYLIQILIATPMLLGRRRLAEMLLKIKYAGTPRD